MHPELCALGWTEGLSNQMDPGLEPGRVLARRGAHLVVRGAGGERRSRAPSPAPAVGDWVGLDGDGAVRQVLPRLGVVRGRDGAVVAANVDLGLVVAAAGDPGLEPSVARVREGAVPACVALAERDAAAADRVRTSLRAPVLVGSGLETRLPVGATTVVVGTSGPWGAAAELVVLPGGALVVDARDDAAPRFTRPERGRA